MEASKNFALKDYLLYYFPGIFWLLDLSLLLLPIQDQVGLSTALISVKTTLDSINQLVLAILLLTIPYSTGFLLETVNAAFMRWLRKVIIEPKEEVIKEKSRLPKNRRVNPKHLPLIVEKIKSTFSQSSGQDKNQVDVDKDNIDDWFFEVRAHVINSKTGAGEMSERAQDIQNFAEGLILPIPLLFIIPGVKLLTSIPVYGVLLILLGLGCLGLLTYRYFNIRAFWIRHTYQAFLAIPKEKDE